MSLIDSESLVKSLDRVNEKLLFGEDVPPAEGYELARWVASRQGVKGAYRGMFAPTPSDFEQGIRLFTGERLFSASARHIMGQEAARIVWLFGRQDPVILDAYHRATGWMRDNLEFSQTGTFCCGRCTMAFWRHVWVGDFENKAAFVTRGLQALHDIRLGDGHWRTVPFFYAIYTLLDLDMEPARQELRYARPAMESYLRRAHPGDYSKRKTALLVRALERVT
jgi:hypothetical protein